MLDALRQMAAAEQREGAPPAAQLPLEALLGKAVALQPEAMQGITHTSNEVFGRVARGGHRGLAVGTDLWRNVQGIAGCAIPCIELIYSLLLVALRCEGLAFHRVSN